MRLFLAPSSGNIVFNFPWVVFPIDVLRHTLLMSELPKFVILFFSLRSLSNPLFFFVEFSPIATCSSFDEELAPVFRTEHRENFAPLNFILPLCFPSVSLP